jgi:hypothetical protein
MSGSYTEHCGIKNVWPSGRVVKGSFLKALRGWGDVVIRLIANFELGVLRVLSSY